MEIANVLCDRIGFINVGKIITLETSTRLKQNVGGYIIDIELTTKNHLDMASISVRNQLKQFGFMHKLELNKFLDNVSVHVDDASINLVLIIRTVTKDMMSHM